MKSAAKVRKIIELCKRKMKKIASRAEQYSEGDEQITIHIYGIILLTHDSRCKGTTFL